MPSPRRTWRRLAVLLVGLALADAAISLFLIRDGLFLDNPVPPFGAITHPRQRAWIRGLGREDRENIGRFDPELGWSWKPSSRTADGLFHVNAIGARGEREYPPLPPEGVTRIVCFGDSFTFGDEVPDSSTFQWIFERRHPDHEVINFGVSGYGTDQSLLRYRRHGRELGAEVVCIGLLLENIGRNVNRYRPLWSLKTGFCSAKPRFVLEPDGELTLVPQPFATQDELVLALEDGSVFDRIEDHEYWLNRPGVPTGRLSSIARLAALVWVHWERSPERLWLAPENEPFQVTLALLEEFHREALADGARAAPVLVFPSKEDLRDHLERGVAFWSELYAELERRGIPCVDLIGPLAARHRELGDEAGSLYHGGHLSNVGNGVVASALKAWLDEGG